MDWQSYVDTSLVGTGKVSKAAILSPKGGVLAISEGFQLPSHEQAAAIYAFQDLNQTRASGVNINGQKYFTTHASDSSVYLKKGGDGAIIVKTVQAVIVAVYESPILAHEANPIVERLGDYLIGTGF